MHRKSLSTGAPPRTPLEEVATLPQTPSRLGNGNSLPKPLGVSTSAPIRCLDC